MSKSTALIPSTRAQGPDASNAAHFHKCAITAGEMAVAAIIFCGQQLVADQKSLKESASGCTFDQWLEGNEAKLGFKRRTAFKYMASFREAKSKLIKSSDPRILRLIDDAPAKLSDHSRRLLSEAVRKCFGVNTVSDFYIEAGIVKDAHKNPDNSGGSSTSPTKTLPAPTPDLLIQDELFLPVGLKAGDGTVSTIWEPLTAFYKAFHQTIKIGNGKAQLWEAIDTKGKAALAKHLRTQLDHMTAKLNDMIAKVEGAAKRK